MEAKQGKDFFKIAVLGGSFDPPTIGHLQVSLKILTAWIGGCRVHQHSQLWPNNACSLWLQRRQKGCLTQRAQAWNGQTRYKRLLYQRFSSSSKWHWGEEWTDDRHVSAYSYVIVAGRWGVWKNQARQPGDHRETEIILLCFRLRLDSKLGQMECRKRIHRKHSLHRF